MISLYLVLSNCQINFQSSCTILYSYQKCMRDLVSLHPHQNLAFSLFFILAIPIGVERYFILFLVCISLWIMMLKHLFMCLFAMCVSSLVKHLSMSSAHFVTQFFKLLSFIFIFLYPTDVYSMFSPVIVLCLLCFQVFSLTLCYIFLSM